jgi:hypothetical protein
MAAFDRRIVTSLAGFIVHFIWHIPSIIDSPLPTERRAKIEAGAKELIAEEVALRSVEGAQDDARTNGRTVAQRSSKSSEPGK